MAQQIEGAGARRPATSRKPTVSIRKDGLSATAANQARTSPGMAAIYGQRPPVQPMAPSAPRMGGPGGIRPLQPPTLNSGAGGVGTTDTGAVAAFATGGGATGGQSPMSDEDWLVQDEEFNDTRAQLVREFENLKAQLGKQRTDYQLDINNSLRNLGSQADGTWNQNDKLTGYGNAFQNQLGDFASRGMLDSSLYGGALNDLTRGFEQQRGDITSAFDRFTRGQELDQTQAQAAQTSGVTAARRQALARMAASLGL